MYELAYQVHKFGGACLANPEKILLAINSILKEKELSSNNIIVVVSATLGVTDCIRNAIKILFDDSSNIQKSIKIIDGFHDQFTQVFPHLKTIHNSLRNKLEISLRSAFDLGTLSDEERDNCLVIGEQFMTHVMVAFLNNLNRQAVSLFPEDLDLRSDGNFFKSRVDFSWDFKKLKELISGSAKENKIIVIPGFYGINSDGKITTFGPSGTDYSATAIANILNAEKIVIWKDVDGFMTSDPRIVKSRNIEMLSYSEAAELAHFGAKILHPRAVLPAQLKQIPIEIRNMNNNVKSRIVPEQMTKSNGIKSISYMKDVGLLKVYISSGGTQSSVLNAIYQSFSENSINIYAIATSSTAITFLLNQNDLEFISRFLPRQHPVIEKIEVIIDICLICVVGKGLGNTPNIASEIFSVVGNSGVNIELITAGASPVALQFTIKQDKLEHCLVNLHQHYFGKEMSKLVEAI